MSNIGVAGHTGYPQIVSNVYPHELLRLTLPDCQSLYFNYSAYSSDGQYLIITTPSGISRLRVGTWEVETLLEVEGDWKLLFTGRRSGRVWYEVDRSEIWTIDIAPLGTDSKATRTKICDIPSGSEIQSLNADESLLACVRVEIGHGHPILDFFANRDKKTDQFDYRATWPDGTEMSYADAKEVKLAERLNARIPMEIFTIDTTTGHEDVVVKATDWLNHLMFSPTDPGVLMYCHEGPWHMVDRLWYITLDLSDSKSGFMPAPVKVHERRMNMEIAGHEWFSADGETIWYDLQLPRGQTFWVAGYHLPTKQRKHYNLTPNDWSVHFHSNDTNTLFCGDGGDESMVAHAPDGKFLYLFTPHDTPDVAGLKASNSDTLIKGGYFATQKLVDLRGNDYRLEPNANFTPDGNWIIFRSNMEGDTAVYAVRVEATTVQQNPSVIL